MKKIITFCFVFTLFSNLGIAQRVHLSPEMHALSGMAYKTKANLFSNIFTPKLNGPFPAYVNQTTSYTNIYGLSSGLTVPATGRYFNVLRIFYGLDGNYNITLIFLPDVAVETAPGSNDFQFQIGYPILDNQTVYLLDNDGNFNSGMYSTTAKGLVANYQAGGNITVNLYGDPGNPNIRDLRFDFTNPQMDAEGSTVAFDEISFYLKYAARVYISSLAEINYSSGYTNYRHGIAFSKNDPSTINTENVLAADLGGLCPIRCKGLMLFTAPSDKPGTTPVHPGLLESQY